MATGTRPGFLPRVLGGVKQALSRRTRPGGPSRGGGWGWLHAHQPERWGFRQHGGPRCWRPGDAGLLRGPTASSRQMWDWSRPSHSPMRLSTLQPPRAPSLPMPGVLLRCLQWPGALEASTQQAAPPRRCHWWLCRRSRLVRERMVDLALWGPGLREGRAESRAVRQLRGQRETGKR